MSILRATPNHAVLELGMSTLILPRVIAHKTLFDVVKA